MSRNSLPLRKPALLNPLVHTVRNLRLRAGLLKLRMIRRRAYPSALDNLTAPAGLTALELPHRTRALIFPLKAIVVFFVCHLCLPTYAMPVAKTASYHAELPGARKLRAMRAFCQESPEMYPVVLPGLTVACQDLDLYVQLRRAGRHRAAALLLKPLGSAP